MNNRHPSSGARGHQAPPANPHGPSDGTASQPETSGTSTTTFLTIQALRAAAAVLVVVHHAFNTWDLRISPGASTSSWTNGASGVDIFFVVSGFVMVMSSQRLLSKPNAWMTFMRHRIVRIVPLYWLLTTLKLLLVFIFIDLVLRSSLDVDYVLRSYLFLPVVDSAGHFRPLLPVGWTLTYEFLFYMLFALALALRVDVLRVVVPAFVVICILALLRTEHWPTWTILFSTIVVEFLFGVLLAKMILLGWRLSRGVAAVAVLLGFALILAVPESPENLRVLTWGLPALAIVGGAVSLEKWAVIPQWLLALGDASYSIYLVHGFVLPILGIGIAALHWTSAGALVFTVVACVGVGSLAGWVSYVLIERPLLNLMSQARR